MDKTESHETLKCYLCYAFFAKTEAAIRDAGASACIVCSIHCLHSFIGREDSLTSSIHIMEHPRSKGLERPLGQIS